MAIDTPADPAQPSPNGGRSMSGRRFTPRNAVRLAPDAAERQGRITRMAIDALGASDAILFLNSQHDGLADRPLALATTSEDGLQSVLRLLNPTSI
ncbi:MULTISPECIES: hypothetical protein [Sphingomonadaceae]|uniref:Antitoxin Xre/MbcA/ParS-like toxin-binding domain-containing protein n=1 Tax=Sphingomonas bisphenolicum TaxID=296544 RepID=A0ABM7G0J7_9SPHN|nr:MULTISPECIES: hypothetical protein [Sphingomonadaceae]MBA4089915.1 hypothetical protein [Sphingobium sp.]MBZ9647274.1 hypothetical protein [Sphingobium sp. 3R8]BBF69427.1 hypothetical protein SBA_ch1_16270 [Sphingomonas bisphenolicum]